MAVGVHRAGLQHPKVRQAVTVFRHFSLASGRAFAKLSIMRAKKTVQRCGAFLALWLGPLALGAAQLSLAVDSPQAAAGRIEFTLTTDVATDAPYDPDVFDLSLELTAPDGRTLSVPAFYAQLFERRAVGQGGRSTDWLYPVGAPRWKARFSPRAAGGYRAVAVLKTPGQTVRSAEVRFEGQPVPGPGFIRVSRLDPRYLEFDSGKPFFAIGQNVAFVKDLSASEGMIRKLGAHGANFARIWACAEDWAMALEARQSGWGRSWDWNPPFGTVPDRDSYHDPRLCLKLGGESGARWNFRPCHPVALRPGTAYRLRGSIRANGQASLAFELNGPRTLSGQGKWTPFQFEFSAGSNQWWLPPLTFRLTSPGNVWLRDLSLQESGGGPELLWEADPNRPVLGEYSQVDCFMLDQLLETAEQSGVYLQLTLLTRDHYMHLLKKPGSAAYERALASARRLLRYCVARWGYSPHVAAWEYFNEIDPGLPLDRFYAELGHAFEALDLNHHLRTVSAWHSPAPHYAHPQIDTCDLHYYLRPPDGDIWKDEVAAVQARWKVMRQKIQDQKPALFAEFGITDAQWQRAPQLDRDKTFVHHHNALWASALSGFASTVCHWYWDDLEKRNLYSLYQPLARFVADVPFTTAHWRPASVSADPAVRVLGLQGADRACLWISDPKATWWNLAMENLQPKELKSARLEVAGLAAGTYRIEWWDTREGKIIRQDTVQSTAGSLPIAVPPFRQDIACKVLPRP